MNEGKESKATGTSDNATGKKETRIDALFQIDKWPAREALIEITDSGAIITIPGLKENSVEGKHPEITVSVPTPAVDHDQAHMKYALFHALFGWAISDGLVHQFGIMVAGASLLKGSIELIDKYTAVIKFGNKILVVYSDEIENDDPDQIWLTPTTREEIAALEFYQARIQSPD
jgi:hypothetical protein